MKKRAKKINISKEFLKWKTTISTKAAEELHKSKEDLVWRITL